MVFLCLYIAGSTCGKISVEECLDRIGDSINQALDKTEGVTVGKYQTGEVLTKNKRNFVE